MSFRSDPSLRRWCRAAGGKAARDQAIRGFVGWWVANAFGVRGELQAPKGKPVSTMRVNLDGPAYVGLVTRAQAMKVDPRDLLTHILVEAARADDERPGRLVSPPMSPWAAQRRQRLKGARIRGPAVRRPKGSSGSRRRKGGAGRRPKAR